MKMGEAPPTKKGTGHASVFTRLVKLLIAAYHS